MTHGQSKTVLYKRWANMKRRCLNPNESAYKWYGARGIRVCRSWLRFEPFQEWAMKSGFKESLTLDRIDSNKNYTPANCRWIPFREQTYNRRSNIKYKGELASHASVRLGGTQGLVQARLLRGWTNQEAFTKKVHPHKVYQRKIK